MRRRRRAPALASRRALTRIRPAPLCAIAEDSSVESAEGWTLVQSTSAPVRFGFVPSDYLQPVAAQAASASAAATPAPAPAAASPSAAAAGSFLQRLGGGSATAAAAASPSAAPPAAPASSSSSAAASFGGLYSGGFAASSSAASAASASALALGGPNIPSAAEEFGQLFASHEEWFRAATAKRHEVYRQLVGEAGDIARALQESEARSAAVVGRLGELDQLLADEKARWAAKNAAAQQDV